MDVSFQQLLSVALPPGPLAPSNATGLSANTLLPQTSFSSALNAAISQSNPPGATGAAVVPTPTGVPGTAPPATTTPLLPTAATVIGTALAAVFGTAESQATAATTLAEAAAIPIPAAPTAADASPTPIPAAPVAETTTSRTEQLRFQFAAATTATRTPTIAPPATTDAAADATRAADAENPTSTAMPAPTAPVLPQIPLPTVADSTRLAARVQTTALTPLVPDRGLVLPPALPQVGYGVDRPPVQAPVETVAAQPVATGNRPGASRTPLTAAQLATEQLPPAPAVAPPTGFAPVLAEAAAAPTELPAAAPPPPGESSAIPRGLPPVEIRVADDRGEPTPAIPQPPIAANPTVVNPVERPVGTARIDVPSPADQVAQSVVSQLRVLSRGESVEYSIRFDPPDLGRVQIRIVSDGDRLSAHVTVASDAVRQLMESQLPELRQRLEQAGVNAPRIDVSTASGQQFGSGNQADSRWQDARRAFPFFDPADAPPAPRARVAMAAVGSGSRVDVTA